LSIGAGDFLFPPGQDELPVPERPEQVEGASLQDLVEGTARKKQKSTDATQESRADDPPKLLPDG
jgi:hypothetical protein